MSTTRQRNTYRAPRNADALNRPGNAGGADPTQEDSAHVSTGKYDQEFRQRAVRMYRERLEETGESKRGVLGGTSERCWI